MYSLDVNFLKDRPEVLGKKEAGRDGSGQVTTRELTPLFVGVGVAALLLAGVGGWWYFANNSNNELEQQITEVNGQISAVDAKLGESRKIVEETNRIDGETKALASVFNQIKPWSAMMQDLRDRIPPGVAIASITQADVAPSPAPTPTPSPAKGANPKQANQVSLASTPTAKVEITGYARSFNDVNDFLLTLQKSSFLKKDQTQLVSAELKDDPTQIEKPKIPTTTKAKTTPPQLTYELPKVVTYRIQTSLSDVPASDLLRELDRKGAIGLVTRIRALQEQGVNP